MIKYEAEKFYNTDLLKPKKITGTKFASILGKNRWSTPFEQWCEITKTWNKPFLKTIYTEAGKVIEKKQYEWYKSQCLLDVLSPEQRYGYDPFKKTWGNFYNGLKAGKCNAGNFDDPVGGIFGGMWDYLVLDNDGKPYEVIECKSTKRASDWLTPDGRIEAPIYYEYQAVLYAYLLGIKRVRMICTMLDPEDYQGGTPDSTSEEIDEAVKLIDKNFVVNDENTVTYAFDWTDKHPDFEKLVAYVTNWYNDFVLTGKSPAYDLETKIDSEIVRDLKTTSIDTSSDLSIGEKVDKIYDLEAEIETLKKSSGITDKEKLLKAMKDELKTDYADTLNDEIDHVVIQGKYIAFEISKTSKVTIDKEKLEADHLLDKYSTITTSCAMRKKKIS